LVRDLLDEGLKAPAGRIANLSSILGSLTLLSDPSSGIFDKKAFAYDASKTTLNAFIVHLAHELRGTRIKVNSAHPGWVRTELGGSAAPMDISEGGKTSVQPGDPVARTGHRLQGGILPEQFAERPARVTSSRRYSFSSSSLFRSASISANARAAGTARAARAVAWCGRFRATSRSRRPRSRILGRSRISRRNALTLPIVAYTNN
jgi:NAD(P)-dependent dehydrogenase (short-subunit alcohol dehydrogenase family)